MKYTLYKPNSKNQGCAMGFSIGTGKDGSPSLYISAVQQASWNDQTKTGSFGANAKDPNKSGNFKMNANEAGEMISSIKTRVPVNFFHKFNQDSTSIKFTPWDKDRKIKDQNGEHTYKSAAFGLSISKNSSQHFKIALEAGETEALRLLLEDFVKQSLFFEGQKGKTNIPDSVGEDGLLGGESNPAPAQRAPNKPESFEDESDDVPF